MDHGRVTRPIAYLSQNAAKVDSLPNLAVQHVLHSCLVNEKGEFETNMALLAGKICHEQLQQGKLVLTNRVIHLVLTEPH